MRGRSRDGYATALSRAASHSAYHASRASGSAQACTASRMRSIFVVPSTMRVSGTDATQRSSDRRVERECIGHRLQPFVQTAADRRLWIHKIAAAQR